MVRFVFAVKFFVTLGVAVGALSTDSLAFFDEPPVTSVRKTTQGMWSDYKEIRRIGTHIISKYPPDQYVYLGMGRSPLSITAFLKATLGDAAAINIPLSGMAKFFPGSQEVEKNHFSGETKKIDFYSDRALNRLREHFDNFIPSESALNGKKILLLDYADTGASLSNGTRELRAYLKLRNPSSTTTVQAFGLARDAGVSNKLATEGIDSMVPRWSYLKKLIQRQFRMLAEYESFDVTTEAHRESNSHPQRPYVKPDARTREYLQNELKEEQKNTHYAGDDTERWVRREKAAAQRRIAEVESFYDLKRAIEARSKSDHALLNFLKQKAPSSPLVVLQTN